MKNNNCFLSRWYSNDTLMWIWARSLIVAVIGVIIVLAIWGTGNIDLFFVVVSVPLILGIFNTMFRDNRGTNKK